MDQTIILIAPIAAAILAPIVAAVCGWLEVRRLGQQVQIMQQNEKDGEIQHQRELDQIRQHHEEVMRQREAEIKDQRERHLEQMKQQEAQHREHLQRLEAEFRAQEKRHEAQMKQREAEFRAQEKRHEAQLNILVKQVETQQHQLQAQITQTKHDTLSQCHDRVCSAEMQSALRFIFSRSPQYLANPQSEAELEYIELALRTYDTLGAKVKRGALQQDELLATECAVLLRMWPQVLPFIQAQRRRLGKTYKRHLEDLVKEADAYRLANGLDIKEGCYVWSFLEARRDTGSNARTDSGPPTRFKVGHHVAVLQ